MVRMLPLAMVALASVPVAAQEPPRDLAPDIAACSAQSARPVTIEQLHGDPALRFECVSVEGILDGDRVAANRRALVFPVAPFDEYDYEEDEREQARAEAGTPNRVRLERSGMPHGNGPMRVRVFGVVDDCGAIHREADAYHDRLNAERTDGEIAITFLTGTCHYHSEVYVHPVAITFVELEPEVRFTSAQIAPEDAGLIEIDEGEVPEGIELAIGAALVRAIAESDENAFHLLTSNAGRPDDFSVRNNYTVDGTNIQGHRSYRDAEDWAEALAAKYGARTILFDSPERRRLFKMRSSFEDAREYPEDELEVISCWCKTADCEDKWPVFPTDADARPQRPYLCVMLELTDPVGQDAPITTARLYAGDYGFAEPDWEKTDGAP